MQLIGFVALFFIAFGNLVDVEAENDSVSIHGQAFIKIMFLAMGGLYGGLGVLLDARVRRHLFSFPVMWIVILSLLYFASVIGSVTKLESLASSISILCVLLMTVTALVQLGIRSVLHTLFAAMGLYVFLSWGAYLFVPSIGVFMEPTVEGQTVQRMGGLSHPNVLGQISGMTILVAVLIRRLDSRLSSLKYLVIAAAALALVFSLSRTSLAVTFVALAVAFRDHVFRRKNLIAFFLLASLGLIALVAASVVIDLEHVLGSKLALFSKSGDTSELYSATGRTEIWSYAIRLIGERPLLGYGAATTKIYLSEYSLHCHNLVLNIAFSTGIFGGLVALWMCLERFVAIFNRRHPVADALVVFILLNGLFENVIFSILAGLPTIIWIVGLCAPQLTEDEANQQLIQQDEENKKRLASTVPMNSTWRLER